jgi:hypothetical protein
MEIIYNKEPKNFDIISFSKCEKSFMVKNE